MLKRTTLISIFITLVFSSSSLNDLPSELLTTNEFLAHEDVALLKRASQETGIALNNRKFEKIVTASFDETAKIWDAHAGRLILTLEGHTDSVKSAIFSIK